VYGTSMWMTTCCMGTRGKGDRYGPLEGIVGLFGCEFHPGRWQDPALTSMPPQSVIVLGMDAEGAGRCTSSAFTYGSGCSSRGGYYVCGEPFFSFLARLCVLFIVVSLLKQPPPIIFITMLIRLGCVLLTAEILWWWVGG
jgi:hypothetical protein